MPILNLIFNLFLTLIFVWLVFLLSWYVALPLLAVWALFGGARWCYGKNQSLRYKKATNGCTLHRTNAKSHTTIIDADYTEVS